jgi:hypothetical protein
MATTKVRDRVRALVDDGEVVQAAFPAHIGPTPWLGGAIGAVVYAFVAKFRIIVATDRSIIVMRASWYRPKTPQEVLERLPRDTRLGPFEGKVWGKVHVAGERHWVHRLYRSEVTAADAALPADPTARAHPGSRAGPRP